MRRRSTRPLGLPILLAILLAILLPVLAAALPGTGAAADGDWVLMGRHGGCAEIADAARRKPAFAGVATPEEFAAKARRQGHAAQVTEMDLGGIKGVSVDVKDLGLAVLFVPRAICDRIKTR